MTTVGLDTLDTLYTFVDRGWNLFPIEPNEKMPVITGRGTGDDGESFAVRFKWSSVQHVKVTKEQVRKWYTQYPNCNWAIVCGKISNLVVLDIDGDVGMESVNKHHPEIQNIKTFMQASPHGFHMFFAHPGNDVKSFPILPKVDVKADGGYIVVHPSQINGEQYRILVEADLAPCPGWIARGEGVAQELEQQQDDPTSATARPEWVSSLLANGSPAGRRNDDAARLVGYFWSRNVPKDIIEQIIAPWAAKCQPPMPQKELATVIRSISSYQQMAKSHGVMDAPAMTSTGTGYKYTWHTLRVEVIISKLIDTERHGLVGEFEVHTNGIPAMPKYLYGPVDVSFKNGQSLMQLSTELEKRMYGPPWRQMITDVARLAVTQFNQGKPWQLLRNAPRAQAAGFAHKPLLLAKEPTLWFSAGGGLKSFMALSLAVQMETGIDLGLGPSLVRHHVAYLDWEWDIGQHARRLDMIIPPAEQEKLGVDIVYRNCGGRPLRKQLDELKRLIAEEGVTYVVIDSASPACGRATDNDEIVAFFQGISQLGVGSLVLAHITKMDRNSNDDVATAFGGVQWENQARSTWHIRKMQDEGSSVADVLFTHQKINAGNMSPPFAVRVHFPYEDEPDTPVQYQLMNPGDLSPEALKSGGVGFKDRIKYLVKDRPMSAEDIAECLGMSVSGALVNTLRSMETNVLIRVVRNVDGQPTDHWQLRAGRSAE